MTFATTAITSSVQGCGGPGGGGGGAAWVGDGGGVVEEDDATAVSDMLGGGSEDDAAAALVGTAAWSSEPKNPTIQIRSSSVTSAAPLAATRRRQYTEDGSGPVGSITARR
ncbi:hypothetical protein GCM10027200_84570 [Lentzea nigeriaca]